LYANFTPSDSVNYTNTTANVTINVIKATPIIIWYNPANIVYGTSLSSTQLNANASVAGSFVYTPTAGAVLSVGTQLLHVNFTPADTANYNTASADVQINVIAPQVPIADFTATPISGKNPLTVRFTDTSTGTPTSWEWDFGDGSTSTAQSPSHKYTKKVIYTVSLTVGNGFGTNTTTKTNYITVS
jgi:PKD repeat protein